MNNKYKDLENPFPYNLPTPYLPKELDIVSAGDAPKTISENNYGVMPVRQDIEVLPASYYKVDSKRIPIDENTIYAIDDIDEERAFLEKMAQAEEDGGGFPGVSGSLVSRFKKKLAESMAKPVRCGGLDYPTKEDAVKIDLPKQELYDCPSCMHESGEGRIKFECNDCNDTGAVDFNKWNELVAHKVPSNISIDSSPEELKNAIKDEIKNGLNGIIFENTEESKKKAVELLRDMLVEMRDSWFFRSNK